MTVKKSWMVAASAAALIGHVSVNTATAADEDLGKCVGVNNCKGQSACATAESACAGQNSCKGKGWIKINKADCDNQEGRFNPLK